jgi:hypothetical protein
MSGGLSMGKFVFHILNHSAVRVSLFCNRIRQRQMNSACHLACTSILSVPSSVGLACMEPIDGRGDGCISYNQRVAAY